MEHEKDKLILKVNQISNQAFRLAQQAYQVGHGSSELVAQAQELNGLLDEIWAQIQDSADDLKPELSRGWSDARLDVGYVLSHGELSTSTRLFRYIQEQKRG